MRVRIWFLGFLILFLTFPHKLGGIRNNILEFGSHLTGLGRACIDRTQNMRKIMKSIWVMNKSLYGVFIDEIIPLNTHTRHVKPSPKIWFKTEHLENLGFSGLGLRVLLVTSWERNCSIENFSWIFKIIKFKLGSIWRDEKNPEIISKMEKIDFSAKFAWKLKFHKNRGKFELRHLFWVSINSIRSIKFFILYF